MALITIIDRYIVRQVLKPLLTAVSIGLLMLLAERMVRLLDVTLGKKNSFSVVFELLAYLVPHYLGFALPAAMFLGLLFGFNKLSKDSEIDAFMAAGIGIDRLARPVGFMALVLCLISIFVFGWLQPHTRYAYRSVLFTIKNVEVFYLAEEGVFMQAGTRTFILDKLSRRENAFERIFLFDYRGPSGSQTITARSGSLIEVEGDPRPVLRLNGGHRLELAKWPRLNEDTETPRAQVSTFDMVDTPLGRISHAVFRVRGQDERELTFTELFRELRHPHTKVPPAAVRAEFHKRLVVVATTLILPMLALPFALGRRRGHRAYRFGVALAIIVAYYEIIEQGALAARINGISPWLSLWLPFAVLMIFAGWRYYNTCFRLTVDRLGALVEGLSDKMSVLRHRFGRYFGWDRA
jgi:lipopolysaccharide export system permease protein